MVFVIDNSACIHVERYQIIQEFAENISKLFDIGLESSLVGVILFSSNAIIQFPITQHTSTAMLLPAINPGLPYRARGTRTHLALELLHTAGESGGELGLRRGFPHVVILVTDGRSFDQTATIDEAILLRASGIYDEIYAIGLENANVTELNVIASDPSLVFFDSTFTNESVFMLQQDVVQKLCGMPGKLFCKMLRNALHFLHNICRNGRSTLHGSITV